MLGDRRPLQQVGGDLRGDLLLVLYTDGLVQSREQSLGDGVDRMRDVLSRTPASADPEDVCSTLVRDLLPAHPQDDVALLAVRMRGLAPDRYVTWRIEADVEQVSCARELTESQLVQWGLEEDGFTAELVVSELVTNATGPVLRCTVGCTQVINAARTHSTSGRCEAICCQLSPSSALVYTSPLRLPKYTPAGSASSVRSASRSTVP
jgi:hypothetical protein